MTDLVRLDGLSKHYGGVKALDAVTFTIEQGEWIAIMGPSGSGKTTLISLLGGLDRPTSGQALVGGVDVGALDESALTRYRAETVGFIFQHFHLIPYLSALENVMLAQYFHSMPDEAQARAALDRVGLTSRTTHRPSQLSGGEQQRVAIARALINEPRLILADEPTGNLDEANGRIVLDLLRRLHGEGRTILLVTHDPNLGRMADRRIELAHGRLAKITVFSDEDTQVFDHLLEQIWIATREGSTARPERDATLGIADPERMLRRMADLGLVELRGADPLLTDKSERRARDIVRRHRLAERLFQDTFSLGGVEAESHACQFEHIISPELDEKICAFLGHPRTCPHGARIPAGPCCSGTDPGDDQPAGGGIS
jgi:putative ABC transport system ATP-binding protein